LLARAIERMHPTRTESPVAMKQPLQGANMGAQLSFCPTLFDVTRSVTPTRLEQPDLSETRSGRTYRLLRAGAIRQRCENTQSRRQSSS
jgi:hypothetical protein